LSKTTVFDGSGIYSVYCIRYNYRFRHLTVAIFRLYMKYLVSRRRYVVKHNLITEV